MDPFVNTKLKFLLIAGILVTSGCTNIESNVPEILSEPSTLSGYDQCMSYLPVFQETFSAAEPPYTGLNLFRVKAANIDKMVTNIARQITVTEALNGQHYGTSARDYGDYYEFAMTFHYDKDFIGWFNTEYEELLIEGNASFMEMCSLVDSYNWYLITDTSKPAPVARDSLDLQVSHGTK